jgi:hypothetical protein
MSYIAKIRKDREAVNAGHLKMEARNQVYADYLFDEAQSLMFPNSQLLTPDGTYGSMQEDIETLESVQDVISVRALFVSHLQRWLSGDSSESVAKKLDVYTNRGALFDGVNIHYEEFRKHITSMKLSTYSTSVFVGLVVAFLKARGITPEMGGVATAVVPVSAAAEDIAEDVPAAPVEVPEGYSTPEKPGADANQWSWSIC